MIKTKFEKMVELRLIIQAKEIFKELDLYRRVGICKDIQLEFSIKTYNEIKKKYDEL